MSTGEIAAWTGGRTSLTGCESSQQRQHLLGSWDARYRWTLLHGLHLLSLYKQPVHLYFTDEGIKNRMVKWQVTELGRGALELTLSLLTSNPMCFPQHGIRGLDDLTPANLMFPAHTSPTFHTGPPPE